LLRPETAEQLDGAAKRFLSGEAQLQAGLAAGLTADELSLALDMALADDAWAPSEQGTVPVPADGVISAAVHLAAIRALKKELLPALYRLETELQAGAAVSAEDAARVTYVERARRRVSAAAELLREVALTPPPKDSRYPDPADGTAGRALGYVNEAERTQLKVAGGSLLPGGTWDAALDVLAQLWVAENALVDAGRSPGPVEPLTAPDRAWPQLGARLLATIARVTAMATLRELP
jgi:hypothetical protein